MELDFDHQTQLFLGLYEQEIHSWLTQRISRCVGAIDVGAAEGEYSLFFLKQPGIQVAWAFEPLGECREAMVRNLSLNQLSDDRRLRLSASFVGNQPQTQLTLDQLLEDIVHPCFIKIDVDGAEVDVLRGADRLLQGYRDYWLVETHSRELERRCEELLKGAGYGAKIIKNAWWRAIAPDKRPTPHNRWLVAEKPVTDQL